MGGTVKDEGAMMFNVEAGTNWLNEWKRQRKRIREELVEHLARYVADWEPNRLKAYEQAQDIFMTICDGNPNTLNVDEWRKRVDKWVRETLKKNFAEGNAMREVRGQGCPDTDLRRYELAIHNAHRQARTEPETTETTESDDV